MKRKRLSLLALSLLMITCTSFVINQYTPNYFEIAKTAQAKYLTTRKDYVIVVDYTKSIFLERLYVLEMKTGEIVIRSTVAHAWNSGVLCPNIVSNKVGSNMS